MASSSLAVVSSTRNAAERNAASGSNPFTDSREGNLAWGEGTQNGRKRSKCEVMAKLKTRFHAFNVPRSPLATSQPSGFGFAKL